MSRPPITDATWQALLSQETNAVFPKLLEINIDQAGDGNWSCIYLTDNNTDLVSNVQDGLTDRTYISFPFALALPGSSPGQVQSVQLSVTNVSRELIDYVRSVVVPMTISITIINASEPNIILARHEDYVWRNLRYDAMTIVGDISTENFLSEPYPGDLMAPYLMPGLFT